MKKIYITLLILIFNLSLISQGEAFGDKGMYRIIREHLEKDEFWKTIPSLKTLNPERKRYGKEFSKDGKKHIFYCFSMRQEEKKKIKQKDFFGYEESDMAAIWNALQAPKDIGFSLSFNDRYPQKAIKCVRKREEFFKFQLWMETFSALITQTGHDEVKDEKWLTKEKERKEKDFDIYDLYRAEEGEGLLQTLHHTDEEEEPKGEINAYVEDFTYFEYEGEGQGKKSEKEPKGRYKFGRPTEPKEAGKAPDTFSTHTVNFEEDGALEGVIGLINDSGVFMQIVNQSPGRGRKTALHMFEAQEVAENASRGIRALAEHLQKQRLWFRNPGRNPGYSLFYSEKRKRPKKGQPRYKAFEYEGDFFKAFDSKLAEELGKSYCQDLITGRVKGTNLQSTEQLRLIKRCQNLEQGLWERRSEIEEFATKFNDHFLEAKHIYLANTRGTENIFSFSLWTNLIDEALDRMLEQNDDDPKPKEDKPDKPDELECHKYPEMKKISDPTKVTDRIDVTIKEVKQAISDIGIEPDGEGHTDSFVLLSADQVKLYLDHLVKEFTPKSYQEIYDEYWSKIQQLDEQYFILLYGKRPPLPEDPKEAKKESDRRQKIFEDTVAKIQAHFDIWTDLLPSVLMDEYLVDYFNVKSVIDYGPYFQKFVEENKTKTDETGGSGNPDSDTKYVRALTLELDWHKLRTCRDEDFFGKIRKKLAEHAQLPTEQDPDAVLNEMTGDIKEVDFSACREKRVPPIAGIKFDRNDRCAKYLTEDQLETKFKEKAKTRESWSLWNFNLDRYQKDQPGPFNITDATTDEAQKLKARKRKLKHEMYMNCMADYNLLNAQFEHSLWKEWFGDENWDGKDPGIQYECITENETVGTKPTIEKLNEILRSMKRICKQEHNIKLPCPDRFIPVPLPKN